TYSLVFVKSGDHSACVSTPEVQGGSGAGLFRRRGNTAETKVGDRETVDDERDGTSTVQVERDVRPTYAKPEGDNRAAQDRLVISDTGLSIVEKERPPPGQRDQPSSNQENSTGGALRRDWNLATDLILQTHVRYREAFLEAQAASNREAMDLLSGQAVVTHNNLERLIGRDRLLSITEMWNPHAERPANNRPMAARGRGNRNPQYARPRRPNNFKGNQTQQGLDWGSNQPGQRVNNGRMRRQHMYRNSVYEELFRMTKTLQGGYQAIDQARARNRGVEEREEEDLPF
ncbi:hypothetical protein VP01_4505g3, partial [Puccinia sorghi]